MGKIKNGGDGGMRGNKGEEDLDGNGLQVSLRVGVRRNFLKV